MDVSPTKSSRLAEAINFLSSLSNNGDGAGPSRTPTDEVPKRSSHWSNSNYCTYNLIGQFILFIIIHEGKDKKCDVIVLINAFATLKQLIIHSSDTFSE